MAGFWRASHHLTCGNTEWLTKTIPLFYLFLCLVYANVAFSQTVQQSRLVLLGDIQLYLELVVNQRATGKIVQVDYRQGNYYVAMQDLVSLQVPEKFWEPARESQAGKVPVNLVPGVNVDYDQGAQRLLIDVPANWLPEQFFTDESRQRYPPQSSFGGVFNYDVYTNKTHHEDYQTSAWNEARVFGRFGSLSNTGIIRQGHAGGNDRNNGYIRYDTSWQYSDEDEMLTYEVGDLITQPLAWSSSVRLGGIQISRNFSLRPDIITYPLPQFSGEAAVPSTAELFINGFRQQSQSIEPGPFTLQNSPFINGAGEAEVVITDALGRRVSITTPFYVANDLLRSGLSSYTLGVGAMRQHYGNRNFSYGKIALDSSYRYGLTDYFTIASHIEGADSLALGGLGGAIRLGQLGVTNASYSLSRFESDKGHKWSLSHQYANKYINLYAKHDQQNANFRDLASYQGLYQSTRKFTQLTVGVPLANYGFFSAGHFRIKQGDAGTNRVTSLSWSRAFGSFGILGFSVNKASGQNGWSGLLSWILPFGSHLRDTVSTTVERNADNEYSERVNYSRNLPSEGGFGWNVGYARNPQTKDFRQADLAWRNDAIKLRGGVYGETDKETYWANASGSLIFMDNRAFIANQAQNSFVVVSTDEMADVPIKYENNLIGNTDSKGHLLIPWTVPYYAGKFEVDPLNLPGNIQVSDVEQRVAVRYGSGYLLRFPMRKVIAANIQLVDEQQQPLPLGTKVFVASGKGAMVGWDGLTYLEALGKENTLTAQLPKGETCQSEFALVVEQIGNTIPKIGPLVCRKGSKP